MNQQKLNELREIAKRATPGPWRYSPATFYEDWTIETPECFVKQEESDVPISDNDGRYIAAANPATVLELLDTIEKYKSALTYYGDLDGAVAKEAWKALGDDK